MQPEDAARLGHILVEAERIARWVRGQTYETFLDNDMMFEAVTRAVQIVGEACWQMSEEFKLQLPEVSWSDIAGMRHRLVHSYFDVDLEIVWLVATTRVPQLVRQLLPFVPAEEE